MSRAIWVMALTMAVLFGTNAAPPEARIENVRILRKVATAAVEGRRPTSYRSAKLKKKSIPQVRRVKPRRR